jgi:hypothetical protein
MVVMSDAPGPMDIQAREAFTPDGPGGRVLNEIFKEVKIDRKKVLLTSAILCRPEVPGEVGKKRFSLAGYMAWLNKENRAIKKRNRALVVERRKQVSARVKTLLAEAKAAKVKLSRDAAKASAEAAIDQVTEEPPMLSPFDCCKPRRDAEIAIAERAALERGQPNGAVVMPVGNYALIALTAKKGLLNWRGSPVKLNEKGEVS